MTLGHLQLIGTGSSVAWSFVWFFLFLINFCVLEFLEFERSTSVKALGR